MTTHNGRGQDGVPGTSGDSELPAATAPYEGVVLPANGDPWTPEQQRSVQPPERRVQPPAGQPWGDPWGPGSEAALQGSQGGAQELPAASRQPGPGPQGPPHGPPPSELPQQQGALEPYAPEAAQSAPHRSPMPPPGAPAPLPPEGAQAAFPGGPPAGVPYGAPHNAPPPPSGPPAAAPGGIPGQAGPGAWGGHALPPTDAPVPQGGALPPEQAPGGGDADATQFIPPFTESAQQNQGYGPGPFPGQGAAGPEDGTQLLPPQPAAGSAGGGDSEATQYIPPVPGMSGIPGVTGAPGGGDSEATQLIPPFGEPGQQGHGQGAHGQNGHGQGAPGPMPAAGSQQGGAPDPGMRKPPPEFESLFRAEPARVRMTPQPGHDEPGSTQSLPLFDHASAQQGGSGPYGPGGGGPGQGGQFDQYEPEGRAARRSAERGNRNTRTGVLIGAGIVGVAVIGLVVGATLSSGGGDDDPDPKEKASTAPAGNEATTKAPDPVEAQAKKLDTLLNDSNNSRATVVRSVEHIKTCKQLGKAASDLRAAAKQRNSLVTRLGQLKTDKLPNSARLTSSLTRAWKSSAAADNHYANWASQTAHGKKNCHKGQARGTGQAVAGNRASGSATAAKKQAAGLWNPTAQKYGLKTRQFSQL